MTARASTAPAKTSIVLARRNSGEAQHVWLNHYVGDDDSSHPWWGEIGQSKRDNAYVRLAVRP